MERVCISNGLEIKRNYAIRQTRVCTVSGCNFKKLVIFNISFRCKCHRHLIEHGSEKTSPFFEHFGSP